MKKIALLFMFCAWTASTWGQTDFNQYLRQVYIPDLYKQQECSALNTQNCDFGSRYNSNIGKFRIPLYFFKGGKIKLTTNEIKQIVDEVNDVFLGASTPFSFYYSGESEISMEYCILNSEAENFDLRANANTQINRISIFLLDSIRTDRGLAYGTGQFPSLGTGNIITLQQRLYETMNPLAVSTTLAHELGHILGLYHTFETIGFNGNNNCEKQDGIWDTPHDYRNSFTTPNISNNFMSYDDIAGYPYSGAITVTACQKAKMLDILFNYRKNIGIKPEVPIIRQGGIVVNTSIQFILTLGTTSTYPVFNAELTGNNRSNTGNYAYWEITTPNATTFYQGSSLDMSNFIDRVGTYTVKVYDKGIYNPTFISDATTITIHVAAAGIISAPTLSTPTINYSNTGTPSNILFQWNKNNSVGIANYEIKLVDKTANNTILLNYRNLGDVDTYTQTQGLVVGHEYSWVVRAKSITNSAVMAESSPSTFILENAPTNPVPNSFLSPVVGNLQLTSVNYTNIWSFNQHKTDRHAPGEGIDGTDDTYSWDCNLAITGNGDADAGKPVYPVADGVIITSGGWGGSSFGQILIEHTNNNGTKWYSGYLHMDNELRISGKAVKTTDVIGNIGSEGADNNHLHFAVYYKNSSGKLISVNRSITERLELNGLSVSPNALAEFTAVGGNSEINKFIVSTTNTPSWTITDKPAWVNTSINGNEVSVTCSSNVNPLETTLKRTGTITVSGGGNSANVVITQRGNIVNYNLQLATATSISPNPIVQGQQLVVNATVKNIGNKVYDGNIACSLWTADGLTQLGDIEAPKTVSLIPNAQISLTFTKANIVSNAGNYLLKITYQDGTAYPNVNESTFVNPLPVTIELAPCTLTIQNGTVSNVTTNSFTANWAPLSNAISYEINVAESTANYPDAGFLISSTNSLNIPNLQSDKTYKFQVRAKCANGLYGLWSSTLATVNLVSNVLTVDKTTIDYSNTEGVNNLTITSNIAWSISKVNNSGWLSVSETSGSGNKTVTITVQSNPNPVTRSEIIRVTGGGINRDIVINQNPAPAIVALELVSALDVSPNPILQGSPVTITATIRNTGNGSFSGIIGAYLYTNNVNPNPIEEKTVTIPNGESRTVTFTQNPVLTNRGTYPVKIEFFPTNNVRTLVGAGGGINPITVTVNSNSPCDDIVTPYHVDKGNNVFGFGWNRPISVTGFSIKLRNQAGTWSKTRSTSETYTEELFSDAGTYWYSVASMCDGVIGPYSTEASFVVANSATIVTTPFDLNFSSEGGTQTFRLTSTLDNWVIPIDRIRTVSSWLQSVTPSSGGRGEFTITVNCNRNGSSNDRTQILYVESNGIQIKVTNNIKQARSECADVITTSAIQGAGYFVDFSWTKPDAQINDYIVKYKRQGASDYIQSRVTGTSLSVNLEVGTYLYSVASVCSNGQAGMFSTENTVSVVGKLVYFSEPKFIDFGIEGGEKTIIINSNSNEWRFASFPTWFSIRRKDGSTNGVTSTQITGGLGATELIVSCPPNSTSISNSITLVLDVREFVNGNWLPVPKDWLTISQKGRDCKPDSLTVSNIAATTVKLNWRNVSYANGAYLRYKTADATDWQLANSNNIVTGNSYVLTNLTPNTTYQWFILNSCPNDVSRVDGNPFKTTNAPNLTLSSNGTNVSSSLGGIVVDVSSNIDWTASSNQTWCTISPSNGINNGTIVINWITNPLIVSRTATITISGGGLSQTYTVTQAAAPKNLELNGSATNPLSISGSTSFDIISNIDWTINSNQTWCTISPSSGSSNGTVSVNWSTNPLLTSRTAIITVSGGGLSKIYTITQAAAPKSLELSSSVTNPLSTSGSTSFDVIANIDWTASSNQTWCTISPSSGTGNGTVSVNWSVNSLIVSRTATITVSGGGLSKTYTVTQAAASKSLELSASTANPLSTGGSTSFDVIANIDWTTSSNQTWCTISPNSSSSNGTIVANWTANPLFVSRTATITVSGGGLSKTYTVTQAAAPKNLQLSASAANPLSTSGSTSFDVIANIDWTASSNQTWCTISPSSGSDNGTIIVNWTTNPLIVSRTATITVSGSGLSKTYTLTQIAAPKSLELSASAVNPLSTSGGTTFDVISNIDWTASSSQTWCTISPSSGSNNGTIIVDWTDNVSTISRTAIITVSGGGLSKTYTVTQAAAPKILELSTSAANPLSTSGSTTFDVIANIDWAVSSNQTWCTISPSSGSNNGTIIVNWTNNVSTISRTAIITVSGGGLSKTYTVTQAAAPKSLELSASAANPLSTSGSTTFDVISNIDWTTSSNQTWCTISLSSGSNNGTITVNWTTNLLTISRTATITVSGSGLSKTYTVTQAAVVGNKIAYYPFNGNANDESGKGHHGQMFGATLTTDRFGNPNSAVYCAGNGEYILIPHHTDFNLSGSFSFSYWFNKEQGDYILSKGRDVESGFFRSDDRGFNFVYGYNNYVRVGDNTERKNTWYFATSVFDGTTNTMKFYINGQLVQQQQVSTPISINNSSPLVMGKHCFEASCTSSSYAFPYKGKIDDVSIYNYGLSSAEILNIYNSEKSISLSVKAFLQGPYSTITSGNSIAGLMNDDLRRNNLIPTTEPYTGMSGFTHSGGGGGEKISSTVLTITGNDAIVDWVVLELWDKSTNVTTPFATRAALLQRDGNIVDIDGISAVTFKNKVSITEYYVVVRHRNHLGVRAATAILSASSSPIINIDFTDPSVSTWGTNGQKNISGKMCLWAGDVNQDHFIKYNGSNNDKNAILSVVGLTTPNNIINAYHKADINLDGLVKYNGASNDKNVILSNVGLLTPNNILIGQISN